MRYSLAISTGGSAFNIKSESIRLVDFTQADVKALVQQHTDASGQTFEILDRTGWR